ncbi:MAG: HAMP domain-containing protein, partial [Proteobacteria bacterium]|nr:HAMP domain-containing protein [Pseudomonadota bacterium]
MAVAACVNCHNAHADSPKKDWKLGDVRGVLEVNSVIDGQLANGAAMGNSIVIGAALIGLILLGITLLTARSVTAPLVRLVGDMKKLAAGEADVAIHGANRRDEIGDIAAAVDLFKVKATETARIEADRRQAEESRMAAARKTEMRRLADDFQAAVGGIIGTVSSTATGLEEAAGSLTHAAEETQSLSATVAAASEEASANVQSVASASEELAGSVNEISRQVQESSRIAGEAVKQAEKTDARI